ncbi:MAG: AMP-binding protein [Anaerolineales bacterium]|nr:AMP-binding protein [Anaerolineales bacterium]
MPLARTLAQRLRDHWAATPDRPALHLLFPKQPDLTLTYAALGQGAAGFARAFAAAGLAPGEVVVLILQHGPQLAFAFWGAILGGQVPTIMPFLTEKLAPEKYRQELAALVAITRPAAIVTYPEFAPEVAAALGPQSLVRRVLIADDITPDTTSDPGALPGLRRATADLALLQHSSGTTGLQKGVALSHQAVFNQLAAYTAALRLAPDDVIASWLPLYHDMGLIAGFVMPVAAGVPLVLLSPFDWVRAPYRLMQAVSHYRGTLTWLPNFAFNFCAQKTRDRDLQGVDLSSWRAVINCSEPMRAESHAAFAARFAPFGLRAEALATCYAMAENVFAVTQGGLAGPVTVDVVDRRALIAEGEARPAADAAGPEVVRMLSAGRPLPNVQVKVLADADARGARRPLPERRVGELALQSDCLLTGYFHRPDLTEQAFLDGWYLTGDLGYLADGEVYVSGRRKDLIIVGGKNVHPQDLEALASEVPGVHPGRVVAFGVFNAEAGTEDVVVVAEVDELDVTDPATEEARAALANAIRRHINQGSDVAVRQVRLVGPKWVLKTSSGKTARAANREKYLAETAAPA